MNSRLFYGTIVLALACDVGTGTAQIQLDAAQRAAIVTAVRDVRIAPPGHSFNISVGAQLPPSIELNYLPVAALSQAPEARALKYSWFRTKSCWSTRRTCASSTSFAWDSKARSVGTADV